MCVYTAFILSFDFYTLKTLKELLILTDNFGGRLYLSIFLFFYVIRQTGWVWMRVEIKCQRDWAPTGSRS